MKSKCRSQPCQLAVGAGRRYYGLLAQRFCYLKREYQEVFEDCFRRQYNLIHRLETNKLRNVAKVPISAEFVCFQKDCVAGNTCR
jgi:MA3 domain